MPVLIERQRKNRCVGEIRVGTSVSATSKAGKAYDQPKNLGVFRLTSLDKGVLETAAVAFGGKVEWCEKLQTWELVTERRQLKAYLSLQPLPNGDLVSLAQSFELYEGKKWSRRCDGVTCETWNEAGDRISRPCMCSPEARKCKLTSRLRVILSEVATEGHWTLRTGSETFDQEVNGFADQMAAFGMDGAPVPVTLVYDWITPATAPGKTGEKCPVVRVGLDPQPIPLAALWQDVQRKALATGSPGSPSTVTPSLPPNHPELPAGVIPSAAEGPPEPDITPLTNGRLAAAIQSIGGTDADYEALVAKAGDRTAVHVEIARAHENGLPWVEVERALTNASKEAQ